MRIIGVNHDPARLPLPKSWEVWPTTRSIGYTYSRIAKTAVEEEWDESVVIIQDDVRGKLPKAKGFTIYGWEQDGHVCPRAFAATPEIWGELFQAWQEMPQSLCPTFTRIAVQGTVLNSCR